MKIQTLTPHTPYAAPKEYLDRYPHIADPLRRAYAAMITAMDEQIGRVEEILCEGPSRSEPSVATGRTLGMRVVNFSPPAGVAPEKLEGRFVPVKITDATSFALKGDVALL